MQSARQEKLALTGNQRIRRWLALPIKPLHRHRWPILFVLVAGGGILIESGAVNIGSIVPWEALFGGVGMFIVVIGVIRSLRTCD